MNLTQRIKRGVDKKVRKAKDVKEIKIGGKICKCVNKPKRNFDGEENFDENENYDYEENYDNDSNTFENASTLEEHFENFGEAIGELAENFLSSKGGRARRKARQEARQEKRISRIKGRQALREARVKSKLEELESAPVIKEQAETQAQQVNQLQKAVQPNSAPISAIETPTGSGGGSEQLYKTLPMGNEAPQQSGLTGMSSGSTGTEEQPETQQEGQTPEKAKGKEIDLTQETKTESPKKKKSKTLYLIIGLVAIVGIYFFMKKKK